ncbi:Glutamyl-tRNA(Gln) amidotransferase subunit B, mitochondrial-like [Oopsacas minuta]|uniref:Glutamyl-tRNA(Gln) amidotransferase subunit B, mitochondrial n=1 Tax=Oopsacas minuta TaxID=111878 RepID=A0AAV7JT56_9METZ|nr:Glutamyl-tRNA(Gln) amidotransferase subunit B, mitochondrial-like [Oopsacas minuta]
MIKFTRIVNVRRIVRGFSTNQWSSKIGLEIHAQIKSNTKLFSVATNSSDKPPNTCADLLDIALPGVLPQLNKTCVEYGLLTAIAMECKVNAVSYFDRKHYFYPDLPAGYQITQQRVPLAENGKINIRTQTLVESSSRECFEVRINRLQLEQDSAKILIGDSNTTLLDYNRAGVGLMEIVTAPDMCTGQEAASFIKELLLLLKTLQVCDCKMEDGSFRVDANVSVHKDGKPAPRVEVKNISGTKFINKAISYEINRQTQMYKRGEKVHEETRMFDNKRSITYPTREKGGGSDYRYIPEPDLPPVWVIDSDAIEFHKVSPEQTADCIDLVEVRKLLVELPNEKRARLLQTYDLRTDETENLLMKEELLQYLENATNLEPKISPKVIYQFMSTLVGILAKRNANLQDSRVTYDVLHQLIKLQYLDNRITKKTCIAILTAIENGDDRSIDIIIEEDNLHRIIDTQEIRKLLDTVLEQNQGIVEKFKDRNQLIDIVRGKVLKESKGRGDPAAVHNVVNGYFN